LGLYAASDAAGMVPQIALARIEARLEPTLPRFWVN
jgi:hypothetical protein